MFKSPYMEDGQNSPTPTRYPFSLRKYAVRFISIYHFFRKLAFLDLKCSSYNIKFPFIQY